ncbi:hypothetical protein WJX84_008710, partial [Apatococcus fuscideae]
MTQDQGRKVAASNKLTSNSKLEFQYSPSPQPEVDHIKKADGFAQKVDKHIQKFQPYLQQTDVTAE